MLESVCCKRSRMEVLMDSNHFIMVSLNLTQDRIESLNTVLSNNIFHIYITLKPSIQECEFCGNSKSISVCNYTDRSYRHLDIFGHPSVIHWHRRRYRCKDCGKTFAESNPFGPETYHVSYAVLNGIVDALRNPHKTYKEIAKDFHVSDTLVQLYADSFIRVPRQYLPENLGIDEIHSDMAKYGGSYLCVFVDNKERCLNEILPDRSKRTLSRHFESIPERERNKVKYVTIDMWEPYKEVCRKYLKNCEIAVDPFHVVEHLSNCFSRLRIDLMNQAPKDSAAYYLLKKWHKLLETDYRLDNTPQYNKFFGQKLNYRDIYNMLLDLNPDLSLAYQLKEMYRDFNRTATESDCAARFDQIYDAFCAADLSCYREFISLLEHWRTEILNSFKRPYGDRKQSNALSENINGQLRTLISISNGISNFERFRARALFCFNRFISYALTQKITSLKCTGKARGKYNKQSNSVIDSLPSPIENDGPDDESDQ